jgi:peptidoglycan/LPS O-acetylase OafA/YrhL
LVTNQAIAKTRSADHLTSLDGWRGISILCVLAAHMLPLGPSSWRLNDMAGPLGMSLFFILSGFLITRTLIQRPNVNHFLIRRFCRILPLAFAFLLVALPLAAATPSDYLAHFLFYANLPPTWLTPLSGHFWSLCVEMQFYVAIALLFRLRGQKGLLLLPVLCVAVTLLRIYQGASYDAIFTYQRIDEILAGCCLALVFQSKSEGAIPRFLGWVNPYLVLGLLLIASHPFGGPIIYLRPYLAAILVGSTLYQTETKLFSWLKSSTLVYIAAISYALYLIHPLIVHSWLGSGETLVKYAKRPLVFLVTFALAHLSTNYYEKFWIDWGKRLTKKGSLLPSMVEK